MCQYGSTDGVRIRNQREITVLLGVIPVTDLFSAVIGTAGAVTSVVNSNKISKVDETLAEHEKQLDEVTARIHVTEEIEKQFRLGLAIIET